MDNKEIVVKNERMKKILGWFEKKAMPVQAFILTAVTFVAILALVGIGFLTYAVLGVWGIVLLVAFLVTYGFVFVALL